MKPKVLVVTDLYPTKNNPFLGTYVKEQIEVLQENFDFKILKESFSIIGRKKAAVNFLKRKPTLIVDENSNNIVEENQIIEVNYSWIKLLPSHIQKRQFQYLSRFFERLLEKIISSGWKPDLIQIHGICITSSFISNIAIDKNIPILLTEHSAYVLDRSSFLGKKLMDVYEKVNKIFFVSHHLLRHFLIQNYKFKSYQIVGNYVNDKFITNIKSSKTKIFRILFIASHPNCKDIPTLLTSIQVFAKIQSDFVVNIVGFDEATYMGQEVIKLIKELDIEKYIVIHGKKLHSEIIEQFSQNDILISTSFSETFGLSVAEAILNGLPVVCTDSGGIREFVNDTNGIVVHIREPEMIAQAVLYLYNNIDKYNSIDMFNSISEKYGEVAFRKQMSMGYFKELNK